MVWDGAPLLVQTLQERSGEPDPSGSFAVSTAFNIPASQTLTIYLRRLKCFSSFFFSFLLFSAIKCSGSSTVRKMKGCHVGKTCF